MAKFYHKILEERSLCGKYKVIPEEPLQKGLSVRGEAEGICDKQACLRRQTQGCIQSQTQAPGVTEKKDNGKIGGSMKLKRISWVGIVLISLVCHIVADGNTPGMTMMHRSWKERALNPRPPAGAQIPGWRMASNPVGFMIMLPPCVKRRGR